MNDQLIALEARVAALERKRAQDDHVHNYRYSKSMTDPGYPFWSWDCRDADGEINRICPQPSGGTNASSFLPDHFPAALR